MEQNSDKWTCWMSTPGVFEGLRAACDKSHQHESWQPAIIKGHPLLPTAQEAAYPVDLCRKVATMAAECEGRGTTFLPEAF